jgi:hypothetical protein
LHQALRQKEARANPRHREHIGWRPENLKINPVHEGLLREEKRNWPREHGKKHHTIISIALPEAKSVR